MFKFPANLTMSATTAMLAATSMSEPPAYYSHGQKNCMTKDHEFATPSQDNFRAEASDFQLQSILTLRMHNATHSPLLRLPRELRDIITSYTLLTSPPPHHSSLSSTTHSSSKPKLPALLQTCHLLRPECAELYYSTKLILAGGAPSPKYEVSFFSGFDPHHKKFLKRCHWLWDAYGTAEQAMRRAGELDRLTGTRDGVWTVGFIDFFGAGGEGDMTLGRRRTRPVYVNCFGSAREPGSI